MPPWATPGVERSRGGSGSTALAKFAHWKQLVYLSPFWTKFFHAYLDYAAVQGLAPDQIVAQSNQAASAAMQAGAFSSTGVYYGAAVK